jgi:ABC-type lipoprotein release transport system permease subunit
MIQLYKMALRDLGRNPRRSILSALALGMGLALLLLMAGVIKGEMIGSMDTSIKLQTGHIQVRAQNYKEEKASLAWEDLIESPDQTAARIAALQPVKIATPRLMVNGIVTSGEESVGVRILGIDPASAANAPFKEGLTAGEFLKADDRDSLLIGLPLAEKLGLKAGDKITLLVTTSNGEVDQQLFNIKGVYSTRTPTYDQSTIFLPLAKAQTFSRTENHASMIFVLLKDSEQTDAVAATLKSDTLQVMTYTQMNVIVGQTEELANTYIYVLYLIVLAITATVIVNTFIMSVFERTREIGILAAIGMKGRRIMAMFFAESSLLAVLGIVMGLIIGGLLVYYATVYGFFIGNIATTGFLLQDTIYAHLTLSDTIALTVLTFIVSLLAALYPAMMASQMEPVEALRGGK